MGSEMCIRDSVNTNTNYNPQAESFADVSAPNAIAHYLSSVKSDS